MWGKRHSVAYLRVSMEDADVASGKELESLSIGGQRLCLKEFVTAHPNLGSYEAFEELIDDGYSGTNFDRPGVTRLLEQVEAGQVDTIIVRDMSRFGRNYLAVGHFLEYIFPRFDVRFISINDHFDTADLGGSTAGFHIAIRNIINQMYSRDISRKIKSAVDLKKMSGEYVYGTAPYGYKKGQKRNTIEVDPDAAKVVRQIFQWAAEGMTVTNIAKRLNEDGTTTPSEYLKDIRGKYKTRPFWSYESVRNILLNRIYTGDTVPFKSHVVRVGSNRVKYLPEDEQVILPDTHEAIVSREMFYQANSVVKSNKKSPSKGSTLLSTVLVCGCCGNKLHRGRNLIFRCATARYVPNSPCGEIVVREKETAQVLLHAIQSQCAIADAKVRLIGQLKKNSSSREKALRHDLREEEKRVESCQSGILLAYESYVVGKLTKEQFMDEKTRLRKQEEAGKLQVALLEQELVKLSSEASSQEAGLQTSENWMRFANLSELTPELVQQLVQKIVVYPGGAIHIDWNFKDEIVSETA